MRCLRYEDTSAAAFATYLYMTMIQRKRARESAAPCCGTTGSMSGFALMIGKPLEFQPINGSHGRTAKLRTTRRRSGDTNEFVFGIELNVY